EFNLSIATLELTELSVGKFDVSSSIADRLVAFRDVFRVGGGHPAADFRHTPCRHLAVGKKAVGVSAH
ncbi:hypothetical protein K0M31_004004, partial [Melipona bicolor]